MERRRFSALTDKKKKKSIYNTFSFTLNIRLFTFIMLPLLVLSGSVRSAMVDRTAALIGEDTITYREIERKYVISRLSEGFKVPLYDKGLSKEEFNKARRYVLRMIIVNGHLKRIALKSPIPLTRVEAGFNRLKSLIGSGVELRKFMRYYEIDKKGISDVIKEKLTVDSFFKKSAAGMEKVTDEEIRDYYESEMDNLFYGRSFEELKNYIRQSLLNRKISKRNDEWLKGEMKKKGVRLID